MGAKRELGDRIPAEDHALLDRLYFLASMGGLVCDEDVTPLDGIEDDEEFETLLRECVARGYDLPMDEQDFGCKMCIEMMKQRVWEQFRRLKVY